jgi:outer membrane protein assembly factor BamB
MGTSAETGLPLSWGPESGVAWKIELPGAGASTPIVLGQRIYLTCFSGYGVPGQPGGDVAQLKRHVVCLNRRDGKALWERTVPTKRPEQEATRENHGYATSSPATDGERLYVFFGTSGVFAYDLDGKPLWQADVGVGTSGWGSAASPIVHNGMVIVNAAVESQSLVAFDARSGKEAWRAAGIKESWNTPILASVGGATELVVAVMGSVLGLDPATGQALWSCKTDIPWYMVPSLVAADGVVYAIGGRGKGGALAVRCGGRGDVTRSHRLWTLKNGSNVSSPVLADGRLYWAHENDGTVFCVEAATGRVVYEERLERAGQIYASPVLADGRIYYTSRGGRTFVVAAKPGFELLAANDLGRTGTFNASPAVAGGCMFLRADRWLFCIGTPR